MKPLQITWREIPQSDAIEADIRSRAAKLHQFCHQMLSCNVMLPLRLRGITAAIATASIWTFKCLGKTSL